METAGHQAGASCRICDNESGNAEHRAREMFQGTREAFTYLECNACGTVQLRDVPDLRPYYAGSYYSFRPVAGVDETSGGLKRRLARRAGEFVRRRAAAYYTRRRAFLGEYRNPLGRQLSKRMGRVVVGFPDYLKDTQLDLRLTPRSAVLDVGSGAGLTLVGLSHFGFRDLTGVDPFLDESIAYESGVRVLKAELSGIERQFDLILANHSVEHVTDPRALLKQMHGLLKPARYAVVRIPVLAEAWRRYSVNWVQLDPPRHLFLFTAATFAAIAETSGWEVGEIAYDSTAFQFWGSEQYARDIPLVDERSYFVNPERSIFDAEQIAAFDAEAASLNARGEGDQAVFYLYKK